MVKILYIEDNEDDYLILRGIMAKIADSSYSIANVSSIPRALDYLSREKTDLVLLDLGLPGCSGKEAYGELVAEFPNIPVIIMSGNEDKKVAYELITLGAEDFFIKGNLYPDLLDRGITYSLKRHELKYLLKEEVTQRKKTEEALRTARDELEIRVQERTRELKRSNEELEQFAYVASHDLQEPIRKIVGFSQIFASKFEAQIDEKSKEHLSYVIDGAKRMQALIQDLLLYSRVGQKELILEVLDFNGVVKEAVGNLEVVIKETRAEIICGQLPHLSAHKSFIVQIFQNLISNS
jgi:signal transduction histidine kinase